MSIEEIETSEQIFSLSQSGICRLCGLNNSSEFSIYEKVDADELTIAELINNYLPIRVSTYTSPNLYYLYNFEFIITYYLLKYQNSFSLNMNSINVLFHCIG